jgi:hypothetical protein
MGSHLDLGTERELFSGGHGGLESYCEMGTTLVEDLVRPRSIG